MRRVQPFPAHHLRGGAVGQLMVPNPPSFHTVPMPAVNIPLKIVVVGDIHAKWGIVHKIMGYEFPHGGGLMLSVGDTYTYPKIPSSNRILFSPGNHENFPLLRKMHSQWGHNGQRYHPIFAGDVALAGGLAIAGMPGIFHEDFFDPRSNTPSKFFTRAMIRAMKQIDRGIDILLMHDAPSGIGFTKKGSEVGSRSLTGVLKHLNPQLAFFGHYHKGWQGHVNGTEVFGMEYPGRSYMVIERNPKRGKALRVIQKRAHPYPAKKNGGRVSLYGWQRDEPERWSRVVFEKG
ncbi:MAG: hypothetical protein HN337_09690 [Deltaproteobacteria bacterium]|jgi:hypothetical protein|nr:hypothetical protein [Deltaproteobacteria bacterium]